MSALPSRSPALRVRPVKRDVARVFVAEHHSHHRSHVGHRISLGAFLERELVAVVVLGNPIAVEHDDGETWEITRLCCGPRAPRFTASRLIGKGTRVALSAGLTLLVSYTRVDEPGTCYLASNWTPVAITDGRGRLSALGTLRASALDRCAERADPIAGNSQTIVAIALSSAPKGGKAAFSGPNRGGPT
jgi:hypothetical protein